MKIKAKKPDSHRWITVHSGLSEKNAKELLKDIQKNFQKNFGSAELSEDGMNLRGNSMGNITEYQVV